MKIAVITGASSGIGKQFALQLKNHFAIDEAWLIARNSARLEETAEQCGVKTRLFSMDLTQEEAYAPYIDALKSCSPDVAVLINCSGFGKFTAFTDTDLKDNLGMIDLNCKAVVAMTQLTLPFMHKGAFAINVASVAAYQPVPYIDIYGATKGFVLSFSRALNRELKSRGISVCAVCPFWTKTAFFDRAVADENRPVVKKYVVMYDADKVVARAFKDALKHKDVSIYGAKARLQCFLTKLLPHSLVMNVWLSQQKLNKK